MKAVHVPVKSWRDLACSPGEWHDRLPDRPIRTIGKLTRRMASLAQRGRC